MLPSSNRKHARGQPISRRRNHQETDASLPEAMDAGTYESILKMKGSPHANYMEELQVEHAVCPFEDLVFPDAYMTYSPAELLLREDMASNKVCWYGDARQDFWQYTRNANPFFALWYSHPLHPISRQERIIITVAQ